LALSAPVPLADPHQLDAFDSGEAALDAWLKGRARSNQASGASRVFVTCDGDRVVGFYSLSASSIAMPLVPGRFRRNMPNPIPVVLLGRLAVDKHWQKQGAGAGLLKDAIRRVSQAADVIGVRGIVVHAISDRAEKFYVKYGFTPCLEPMTLAVVLEDIQQRL
jgi:predicted N-acetyltransferase YhbS